jgi:hypothetical protein
MGKPLAVPVCSDCAGSKPAKTQKKAAMPRPIHFDNVLLIGSGSFLLRRRKAVGS